MNFLKLQILRKSLLIISYLSLMIWAVSASILLFKEKNELLLIGIDSNGTRVISTSDDPLFKTETVRFIQYFCGLLYNFDKNTFFKTVGEATQFFSQNLWESEREKIFLQAQKVKDLEISHIGRVTKISKINASTYQAIVEGNLTSRANHRLNKLLVTIEINKSKRTRENPWGIEVTRYEETPFN